MCTPASRDEAIHSHWMAGSTGSQRDRPLDSCTRFRQFRYRSSVSRRAHHSSRSRRCCSGDGVRGLRLRLRCFARVLS